MRKYSSLFLIAFFLIGSLLLSSPSQAQTTNLALSGTGYRWMGLTSITSNSNRAAVTGINDNNLTTDVPLTGSSGTDDAIAADEAAGVIWSTPQTITSVKYINGSFDSSSNGVFTANFGLQFTTDGTTWTASGWSYTPAYAYDSSAAGGVTYTFTGSATNILGVRAVGQVHASDNSNSWHAAARELQAFGSASAPTNTPTTAPTNTVAPTTGGSDGTPYGGTAAVIPGTIEAENYNVGGENVAYFDTTAGNTGGVYRTDDVDIQACTDTGCGYNIGWIVAGEWLKYTVNVQTSASYTVNFRVSSTSGAGQLHLEVDGTNVTGTLTAPNTGAWQTWATISKSGVNLSAGQHVLRVYFDTAGLNLNWISFSTGSGSTATSAPSNTPTFVPPTATHTAVPPSATPNPGGWPAHYYVPYIDVSIESDLTNIANTTGSKFFSLAFIIDAGTNCQAEWGGTSNTMSSSFLVTEMANLRAAGGDAVVSFGGAAGNELALDCSSVSALQAQYQAVINKYNFTHLDFDVEGAAISNTSSIDRRNKAIKALEAANPNLVISYTLAVDTTGLPSEDLSLLSNAVSNGTRVDVVNIMAMDYGRNLTNLGSAATQAATATESQIASIFTGKSASQLWYMIGVTPMIGVNDTNPETFTLANASTLLTFSQSNGVREIGQWSMNRDHQCPSGLSQPQDTCSGVSQANYQFSTTWKAMNK